MPSRTPRTSMPFANAAHASGKLGLPTHEGRDAIRVTVDGEPVCSRPIASVEPKSGIEPDPPVYETGARPIELRGQSLAVRVSEDAPARAGDAAPAEGIEPSKGPVNSRVPDHQASLEFDLVTSARRANETREQHVPTEGKAPGRT